MTEKLPPFDPDYDLITYIERKQGDELPGWIERAKRCWRVALNALARF